MRRQEEEEEMERKRIKKRKKRKKKWGGREGEGRRRKGGRGRGGGRGEEEEEEKEELGLYKTQTILLANNAELCTPYSLADARLPVRSTPGSPKALLLVIHLQQK